MNLSYRASSKKTLARDRLKINSNFMMESYVRDEIKLGHRDFITDVRDYIKLYHKTLDESIVYTVTISFSLYKRTLKVLGKSGQVSPPTVVPLPTLHASHEYYSKKKPDIQ